MTKSSTEISLVRLRDINKSVKAIVAYTKDMNCNLFVKNKVIRDAVLYNFLIIGEAINNVDKEILKKSTYPWYKVKSFRNFVAHEYFNIKFESVWMIIEKDLPELGNEIILLIKRLEKE